MTMLTIDKRAAINLPIEVLLNLDVEDMHDEAKSEIIRHLQCSAKTVFGINSNVMCENMSLCSELADVKSELSTVKTSHEILEAKYNALQNARTGSNRDD